MNIGFIGLGNMGRGMASNLLTYCQTHQHQLLVLDLNQSAMDELVGQGATAANDAQTMAQQADILFTSLPSAREIGELAVGEQGLLENLKSGAVWFETSTNDLAAWQALIDQAPSDLLMVDAPVTGGAEGAAAGTLTMLLGIEPTLFEQHQEMLASFTNKAVRMGPSGAGYVSKLCQLHLNYLVAQGIGETLMLGARADLDLGTLYQVLQKSCAQSYVVDNYIPKVLDGSYDPSFALGLANKDMRLITELAAHLKVPTKLADTVYADYQEAVARFGSDAPHLKIVQMLEDEVGVSLPSSLAKHDK
ncbi:MAG: NAD(P)-dependent oxidoreductase [Pseudomonadota bacterium]